MNETIFHANEIIFDWKFDDIYLKFDAWKLFPSIFVYTATVFCLRVTADTNESRFSV